MTTGLNNGPVVSLLAATREMLKEVFTVKKSSANIKYKAVFRCAVLIAYFILFLSLRMGV